MARKILLADDSVTAQNMGRKILADAGYDVVTVNNGSAALKRIAEIKPDLIVLDVYMPGYSGLEVCQRLKDAPETAHIPVLLTVGKLEPFKPDEARRVKADAHIVKPFEASELLTAITRLEDRMVPLQADGTRGEGSENSSTETGWKSRLRFPSKKKKEEPEPEDPAIVGGTFRDFRKGKSKSFTGKAAAGQEPELVPDIPRDITPEELDVLSALAAKLDGPTPAAENVAPLPDTTTTTAATATATVTKPVADEAAVVEVAATQAAANEVAAGQVVLAEAEIEVATAAAVSADAKTETEAKVQDKTEVETPAPAVEAATFAGGTLGEVAIPAEHVELAAESAAVVADTVAAEANRLEGEPVENQHPETPAAVIAVGVNTALLAEDPAPVDRNDEPVFASSANAVEPTAQDKTEFRPPETLAESHTVEAIGAIETTKASEASALVDVVAAANLESQRETFHGEASPVEASKAELTKTEESNAGELQAESPAQVLPIAADLPEEAEETAPSDEELAQALSLLTPASAHAEVSAARAHETGAASGSRWIAEPAVLSREESEISLEAEMFRTFAAVAAAVPAAVSSTPMGPGTITGVSAIAAAVENRLAEAELAARTKANLAPGPSEPSSSEPGLPTGSESSAVDARVEVMSAKVSDEASATEATAATLADAGQSSVGQGTSDATTEPAGESVRGTADVPAAEHQDSSSGAEEQESMGKDVKSKSGKSSWRQIRTAPAGTPASEAVETQEAPKAMAAAAAAEGASSSSSSPSLPDASTIASIVDSVMADLRPKIVEEIARKLAGK